MKRRLLLVFMFLAAAAIPALPAWQRPCFAGQPAAAAAPDDWKKEFDDICSKTEVAATLSKEELKTLMDRCDRLMPKIEQLDESQRKVYSGRLKRARDFFFFMLETKNK
ncbi:MAG: hypothetical protein ABSG42_03670 [Nitrospirota bacterium]